LIFYVIKLHHKPITKGESMARNEKTSSKVASLASKGLRKPSSLTNAEIKKISASVLTQAPDKRKKR
jgi:hypothetical protein